MATGRLQVQVYRGNSYVPVPNAKITVIPPESRYRQGEQLQSNEAGQTQVIDLQAPPIELSLDPNNTTQQPYSTCDVTVEAEGYEPFIVRGCQILPERTALQVCNLTPTTSTSQPSARNIFERGGRLKREVIQQAEIVEVPANTLFGNFPPKIPEDPLKIIPPGPSGLVVLKQVVVPEFIIVHAGVPTNTAAPNYRVRFPDYIKNVASCEIYATWNESAIRANLYCILSFTLNRIYTEWYTGKGYNFNITNSTAFDHAFTYGRNVFDNISRLVDELFTSYVKRPSVKQPLLTQYCDGKKVQCPNWLTQWGSQDLAQRGRTPYEILTNFYGSNLEIAQAEKVSGIPKSYPGYTLKIGTKDPENIRVVQNFLNRISQNFPEVPKVAVDGVYNDATANAVKIFQGLFNLPQTGEVDYSTWYKISNIYVGVSKIAELRSTIEPKTPTSRFIPPVPYEGIVDIPTIKYPRD